MTATTENVPRKRGFAALTPAQRSAIASLGGKAAHRAGTAHQFTSEEAAAAGRKSKRGKANRSKSAA